MDVAIIVLYISDYVQIFFLDGFPLTRERP